MIEALLHAAIMPTTGCNGGSLVACCKATAPAAPASTKLSVNEPSSK